MKHKIEDILQKEGCLVTTTAGVSMYPMLRNRRDTVVVRPAAGRLKKYDVALYKRGESYVLHRVVKVLPDGYVICGDNCLNREYNITEENILGVLTECYRGEKKLNLEGWPYRIYVRLWCAAYPLRYGWKKVRMMAGRRRK